MKKIFIVLLAILILFSISIPASAQEKIISSVRTDFEDGSYCVTTIVADLESICGTNAALSTKSGTKYCSYYDTNNSLQFTVSVRGSFTYNGTTANATSSQYGYHISDSNWFFVSGNATLSGATATSTCTFRLSSGTYKTLSVSLTCSAAGVLS